MAEDFDVNVRITMGSDGRLRVESSDVPGLFLSSHDHEDVLADILPAIKFLLEHNVENIE